MLGVKPHAKAFVYSDAPGGKTPCRTNRVTHAFMRICKDVGISGVRLHDFRHFVATCLLAAGVPVNTVTGRLGPRQRSHNPQHLRHFLDRLTSRLLRSSDPCSMVRHERRGRRNIELGHRRNRRQTGGPAGCRDRPWLAPKSRRSPKVCDYLCGPLRQGMTVLWLSYSTFDGGRTEWSDMDAGGRSGEVASRRLAARKGRP
jgi:hypothetical protein